MANVDLPTPQKCPIKASDGEICMCTCKKCEWVEVDICFSIRAAYRFGYVEASDKYIKSIREAKKNICNLMDSMTEDGEDDADSSD